MSSGNQSSSTCTIKTRQCTMHAYTALSMPQLSSYARCRILSLSSLPYYSNNAVAKLLKREGISVSPVTVWRLKKHLKETSSIKALQRSGPTWKLSSKLDLIQTFMRGNSEATASQLQDEFQLDTSLSTIRKARRKLGWTYKGAAYCQIIRQVNVKKRFDWAKEHLYDDFHFS